MSIFSSIMGDPNAREIAKIRPIIDQINAFEPSITTLSDDGLKAKTVEFKQRLADGASVDDLLPEAFAVVRECSRRQLKQRQYDVQLVGGVVLHRGMIAEMRTGEGKTLTAVAPVYLNALTGKGAHVVTVNDYLSRRDSVWMGQVYHALGLSVATIQNDAAFLYDPDFKAEPQHNGERDETGSFRVDMDYLRPVTRQEAYAADITYGTNNEFGFDYLRDSMVQERGMMVQRDLHYAIIDEVDSILIDEARTPLIISTPAEEATELYYRFAELVTHLDEETDYVVDEKLRTATLNEPGITKIEKALGVENLYVQGGVKLVYHLEQALRAHALFKVDHDYVVKDGEVIIVDEFTGRLMRGRRYSEGLHQAIEAKERVPIQRESTTMATITFQNLFRMYEKLSGMTGTAVTEAEEFNKIYKLEVLSIPTNRPNQRVDAPDRVYKNQLGKFQAVVREIKELHERGQPVLVGTVSIERNELLSTMLRAEGIPFNLLNAKNHEREAEYIAQAGRRGGVTIATNMAGRGVDIILGGNPPTPEEAEAVRKLGGLHVLGTERHESRRIDNQLRGRSGRQGDPGTTQFYVSMDDDLMRIFGSDKMKGRMEFLGLPDDEPIESKMLSKAIETAQKKVEGHNFDIRKHLLEYDDVLNRHRTVIYNRRRFILDEAMEPSKEGERSLKKMVMQAIEREIEQIVLFHTGEENPDMWDLEEVEQAAISFFPAGTDVKGTLALAQSENKGRLDVAAKRTALIEKLMETAHVAYTKIEEAMGDVVRMADLEKSLLLHSSDLLWVEHLEAMDHLRKGIGLQGYGQHDPLVEYKREAFRMFNELLATIDKQIANGIFKVQLAREIVQQAQNDVGRGIVTSGLVLSGPAKEGNDPQSVQTAIQEEKFANVGRNEPCPCGSGKKFKKCHGANL